MRRSLALRIPSQPEAALSPNASRKIHWGTKAKIRKKQREAWFDEAWAAVLESDQRPPLFTGPVVCTITIYRGKNRKPMDQDNLLAAMKAGLDQLQEAGVIANDKQLVFDPVVQERDPDGVGYTLVALRALTGEAA